MEQEKKPRWRSDTSGPEAANPRPEDKRDKKRSKKSSEVSAALIGSEVTVEGLQERQKTDRVKQALVDYLVDRETKSTSDKKKKSADKAPSEPETKPTEKPKAELTHDEVVETDDDAPAHEVESSQDELEPPDTREKQLESAYAEEDGKEERLWHEVPLNTLNGGEILIKLQGEEPITERIIPNSPVLEHSTAEPEVFPVAQADEALQPFQIQPEQPQQSQEFETPRVEAQQSDPDIEDMISPSETVPEPELTSESDEPEAVPMFTRAPEPARRLEPAEAYRMYMERESADRPQAAQPGEEMVTKRYAEDEAYYAARAGQNRGLATGLFIGVLFEHFRHRRRERKAEKRFKEQGRQLKKVKKDQQFLINEQASQRAESQRQLASAENRIASTQKRFETRDRFAGQPRQQAEIQPQSAQGEVQPVRLGHPSGDSERLGRQPKPEFQPGAVDPVQRLEVPEQHRLEQSQWHTIEVDARTGKPVERPTFAYGHEYYQERSHEGVPATQRNAIAGTVALTGASAPVAQNQVNGDQTAEGSQPLPPNIPSATRQGPIPPTQQLKNLNVRNPFPSTGPIWPYVVALLVIFICLIFLV